MPLPTISSINPTSAPAIPAMTYPNAWLQMMHFYAADNQSPWSFAAKTVNYNASTDAAGQAALAEETTTDETSLALAQLASAMSPATPGSQHSVSISDIRPYAAKYPAVGPVLVAFLNIVPLIQAEQAATTAQQAAKRALALANALPDTNTTKTDAIATATAALNTATTALNTAMAALGYTG